MIGRSAVLAHHERQVAEVLDTIEPWASDLARKGRRRGGRRAVIRLIGSALLVEHRVSGRVGVGEVLNRKLGLIGQTARLMTDLIDTERSLHLEAAIVLLIVFEIGLTLFQMAQGWAH